MLVPMRADAQGQRALLPFKGVSFRLPSVILDLCFLILAPCTHTFWISFIFGLPLDFVSCFSGKQKKKKFSNVTVGTKEPFRRSNPLLMVYLF